MKVTVNYSGRTKAILTQFKNLVDDVIDASLMECAELIQEKAKENAPVMTGALRNSIFAEKRNGCFAVGSNLSYAVFNEFGTGQRGGQGGEFLGMPPHPFLQPAVTASKNDIVKIFADKFRSIID